MAEQWLKNTIGKGIAMLLLLRMKNSPPDDAIKPTLQVWLQVITYKKEWIQELDQWRIEEAFMHIAKTCDWFPTPKQLLEAMPPRQIKVLPPTTLTEEQWQKNQQRIQQLLEQMRGGMVCKK